MLMTTFENNFIIRRHMFIVYRGVSSQLLLNDDDCLPVCLHITSCSVA